tara:strand:- start:494 stop:697 length:204 start_codon:yes stop_codon:yes gene_type:complete
MEFITEKGEEFILVSDQTHLYSSFYLTPGLKSGKYQTPLDSDILMNNKQVPFSSELVPKIGKKDRMG